MRAQGLLKAMQAMKSANPNGYKAKVRSLRVTGPGDMLASGSDGCTSKADRDERIQSFFVEATKSKTGVSELTEILWLTQPRYIAHCRNVENFKTDEEAQRSWEADFADPDILKRGTKDHPEVPVAGVPKTIGKSGTSTDTPTWSYIRL
jgi:hypothetical protein